MLTIADLKKDQDGFYEFYVSVPKDGTDINEDVFIFNLLSISDIIHVLTESTRRTIKLCEAGDTRFAYFKDILHDECVMDLIFYNNNGFDSNVNCNRRLYYRFFNEATPMEMNVIKLYLAAYYMPTWDVSTRKEIGKWLTKIMGIVNMLYSPIIEDLEDMTNYISSLNFTGNIYIHRWAFYIFAEGRNLTYKGLDNFSISKITHYINNYNDIYGNEATKISLPYIKITRFREMNKTDVRVSQVVCDGGLNPIDDFEHCGLTNEELEYANNFNPYASSV